jgi:Domain of unknown function (DUF4870)
MAAYPEQDQPGQPADAGVYLWPSGDSGTDRELAGREAGGHGPGGWPLNGTVRHEWQQAGAGGWQGHGSTVNGGQRAGQAAPGGWPPGPADWQQPAPARPGGDDQAWAILGYMSAAIFGFGPPLLIYLLKLRGSPSLCRHVAQAVNTAATMALYLICVLITAGLLALDSLTVALAIAVPLAVVLWLATAGYLVRAAVAASRGEFRPVPSPLCATIVRERQQRQAG